jgi:AraC family transcriptional regulator, activator of mtrCDE
MPWAQLHRGPDLLADVLREVHSSRRAFARAELRGRWSMDLRGVGSAHFHAVEQGSCWVLVPDQSPIELEAGDVALLPNGGGHRLASHRSGRGRPFEIPDPREDSRSAAMVLHHDGPGELTLLVCGALGRVPGGADAALATLPSILVARRQDPRNR